MSPGDRPSLAPAAVSLPRQLAALAAVFAASAGIAELAGATNLGTALGIGQIAFALALTYLLLRR